MRKFIARDIIARERFSLRSTETQIFKKKCLSAFLVYHRYYTRTSFYIGPHNTVLLSVKSVIVRVNWHR